MPPPAFFKTSRRKSSSDTDSQPQAKSHSQAKSQAKSQPTLSKFFSPVVKTSSQTSANGVSSSSKKRDLEQTSSSPELQQMHKKPRVSSSEDGPSSAIVNAGDRDSTSLDQIDEKKKSSPVSTDCRRISKETLRKLSAFSCSHSQESENNSQHAPGTSQIQSQETQGHSRSKSDLDIADKEGHGSPNLSQDSGVCSASERLQNSRGSDSEEDKSNNKIINKNQSNPSASSLQSKFSHSKSPQRILSQKKQAESKKSSSFLSALNPRTKTKYTPLEQQFVEIKTKHPDVLLFVECGYKFRFFGDDAEIAAKELNIFCHLDHNFQTASIPVHRLHVHVRRLVSKGYKVGVVKQTETAALKASGDNKTGPFSRQLTALYTKATLIGEDVDPVFASYEGENVDGGRCEAYLMIIHEVKVTDRSSRIAVVAIQPSTGDLLYDDFEDNATRSQLETRISHIGPVEVLLPRTILSDTTERTVKQAIALSTTAEDRVRVERISDDVFLRDTAVEILTEFYGGDNNSSTSCPSALSEVLSLPVTVVSCLSGMLSYLKDFNLQNILKLTSQFQRYSPDSGFVKLSACSLRNLELFRNSSDGSEKGSLFQIMDHTSTKFGSRKLRQWLAKPLLDIREINQRLDAVEAIASDSHQLLAKVKVMLTKLPDLERGLGTIYHKKCSTGDFMSVCSSLHRLRVDVSLALETCGDGLHGDLLGDALGSLPDLLEGVGDWVSALNEKAAREGDKTTLFTNEAEFPKICEVKRDIEAEMLRMAEHKKEARKVLRLPALEYTTVQGTEFLLEVKNTNLKQVPNNWIKINSTKVVSRFHSPAIVSSTKTLAQLRERLQLVCDAAWKKFLTSFEECYPRYKKAVQNLATLDCLYSLGQLAQQEGYSRPQFVEDQQQIYINQGRHPVVNTLLSEHEQFVPNDTKLSSRDERCMVITGPNMGGKSSYIKQVALAVIMAQMGSFVLAESATLSTVDAVYTRMGASDDLYQGRSTFMVELQEASEILAAGSPRSLVILDELGRGTSTHDGVAIAMAVLSYFVEQVKCLTLFVTHYPPLARMASTYGEAVGNYHMAFMVNDNTDKNDFDVITFLYMLTKGSADSSYGLNVARLAQIPDDVLSVAARKSRQLRTEIQRRKDVRFLRELFSSDKSAVKKNLERLRFEASLGNEEMDQS